MVIALAHAFVGDGGPGAGFMHPLTGPDHLLAMFAVGILSAQIGGKAVATVPSAFVLAMIAGGMLGLARVLLPGAELGVAASVVVLGAAVAVGARTPLWAVHAAAGLFGLFHGFAHGAEMPVAASPALYALGFAVSTAGVHALGALTGLLVLCRAHGPTRLRWSGAAIGIAGLLSVASVVRQTRPAPAPNVTLTRAAAAAP